MSYVIFGRAIKNEYLTLGTLAAVGGIVFATSGGEKKAAPAPGKTLVEKVKEAVPISAGSSIKNFIAEAEKADKH
ncbi:hypothetical protein HWV62_11103 [Athelia sp. TMB]|nr:hypothetical protein HWV62_27325 [Athelia sp. TMB]KAF7974859.1 hypothetical protein HWV62_11103 [Athelia sp. TMB]